MAGEGQEVDRGTRDGQREEEKGGGAGQGVEEGKMVVRSRHRARAGKRWRGRGRRGAGRQRVLSNGYLTHTSTAVLQSSPNSVASSSIRFFPDVDVPGVGLAAVLYL